MPLRRPNNYGVDVTPVWTSASGTPPAIGNGTLAAHLLVMGKFLKVDLILIAGSTTTFGGVAQAWSFTLPSPYNGNAKVRAFGAGLMIDSSAPLSAVCAVLISTGANAISMFPHGAAGVAATANIPWTWADGDSLRAALMFELT